MESITSDNRKETEVGKKACRKDAKLNEKNEGTPTKLTNQEESKIQKRAKHDWAEREAKKNQKNKNHLNKKHDHQQRKKRKK